MAALTRTPPAPSYLGAAAKAEWRRAAAALVESGTLTRGDLATLESYAVQVGLVRDAATALAAEGLTVKGPRGAMVRHPAGAILREATTAARHLATALGLTPTSRAKATAAPDPAPSADHDLLDLL